MVSDVAHGRGGRPIRNPARGRLKIVGVAALAALIAAGGAAIRSRHPRAVLAGRSPDDAWARCGVSVAHALGGLGARTYTNTLEAFEANYARGFRVFEIDFDYTRDRQLVAVHDWATLDRLRSPQPTLAEFEQAKLYGELTPLTADRALALLARHRDVRFVLDTKEPPAKVLPELVAKARTIDSTVLDRLIPQIWTPADLVPVLESYPFPSVIWTLYRTRVKDDEVVDFARRQHIGVVTMSQWRFRPRLAERLRAAGIVVYVHTINSDSQVARLRRDGASGVYTDFLPPDSACRE